MCIVAELKPLLADTGLRRTKLSHDPNNTAWTRSTTGFGQRILISQGWTPGEFLGAKDAPHAGLYTQSSASHIRVTLKDDNLGLGAKCGANAGDGQYTGLDILQGVLGRLNGKDQTVIEAEQKFRADLRKVIHAERRWGSLRFVSGGLLVGDSIRKLTEGNERHLPAPENGLLELSQNAAAPKAENRIAKDIAQGVIRELPEVSKVEEPQKAKKRRRFKSTDGSSESESRKRMHKVGDGSTINETTFNRDTPIENETGKPVVSKAKRQAEKAERKLQRKLRREAKEAASGEQDLETPDIHIPPISHPPSSTVEKPPTYMAETKASREVQLRDGAAGGRHGVRQRYIRHKKMAMMDTKALHEVCMANPGSSNRVYMQVRTKLTVERLVDSDDKSIAFQA